MKFALSCQLRRQSGVGLCPNNLINGACHEARVIRIQTGHVDTPIPGQIDMMLVRQVFALGGCELEEPRNHQLSPLKRGNT
jgi:hypothetical protein